MALRIVHSNIKDEPEGPADSDQEAVASTPAVEWAKEGYEQAIIKNADLIAEIQRYFPMWMPKLRQ
jgi:hypothetical protein